MEPKLTDKQLKRMENGREYRAMTMEIRDGENDETSMIVEGYATTFNQPYTLYDAADYKVIEQIDAHAFDGCDMSDVIMQYDHEGRVFARNKNGTLTLTVDSIGLKITANLSGTEIGRQLYQEIKGGYTDKEAERNILANPFKRFEDMQMLRHTKTLGVVQVDDAVWKKLTKEEKAEMERICDQKLAEYFEMMG